jgi:hypothetical protein
MLHAGAFILIAIVLASGAQHSLHLQPPAESVVERFHARSVRTPTSYRAPEPPGGQP